MMEMNHQEILEAIEEIKDHMESGNQPELSMWEEEFTDSVEEFFLERDYLTHKQQETLRRIWEKIKEEN